jgi:hypothetical protein
VHIAERVKKTDSDSRSSAKAADPIVDRVGARERLRETEEAIRLLEGQGYKVIRPSGGSEDERK